MGEAGDKLAEGIGRYRQATETAVQTAAELARERLAALPESGAEPPLPEPQAEGDTAA